jgi:hypothetical protein
MLNCRLILPSPCPLPIGKEGKLRKRSRPPGNAAGLLLFRRTQNQERIIWYMLYLIRFAQFKTNINEAAATTGFRTRQKSF